MFPFKLPLVLGQAAETVLIKPGTGGGKHAEEGILSHPQKLKALLKSEADAGADCLYLPSPATGGTFSAEDGPADQTEELLRKLTALCKESAGESTLFGGCLPDYLAAEEEISPAGFLSAVEQYSGLAGSFKKAGADFLEARFMGSLAACRAAALGASKSGLPLFITVNADFDGPPPSPKELCVRRGDSLLSLLITLQEMGVAAFGVSGHKPENSKTLISALSPYAKIPLISKPAGKIASADYSPEDFSRYAKEALQAGARIIGGGHGTEASHIKALKELTGSFDFSSLSPKKEPEASVFADAAQLYFPYENAVLSPPLSCSVDMSEEILEAENDGADVLLVVLASEDDAVNFAENAYMVKLPVCFSAQQPEFLLKALSLYHGRALADSRSGIDPELLQKIVVPFGAAVY